MQNLQDVIQEINVQLRTKPIFLSNLDEEADLMKFAINTLQQKFGNDLPELEFGYTPEGYLKIILLEF